jgi:hypothetical protein
MSTSTISVQTELLSHADFAAQLRRDTIGCLLGRPYRRVPGLLATTLSLLIALYTFAPLVGIPVWAYHAGDWWLLTAIPITYLAILSAAQLSRVSFYLLCYGIGFWLSHGFDIHQRTTFCILCALTAYVLFQLATALELSCARQALLSSPEIYDEARAGGRIRLASTDPSSHHTILTHGDIAATFSDKALEELKPLAPLLAATNIGGEAFTYALGLVTGLIGVVGAYLRGIQNLSPTQADTIMRRLKKGTVGAAMILLGYISNRGPWAIFLGIAYIILWMWAALSMAIRSRRSTEQPAR